MIDYGYFRHRFDAHENTKLNRLVDEIGVEGYGYYYTLLEIYGAHYSKKKESLDVEIHLRVIANTWRKRVDSCHKVLTKLQLSGLLVVTIKNSTCILNIPNYLEYYGPYKKTKGDNASNKIKENKIKENKRDKNKNAAATSPLLDLIVEKWNTMAEVNFLSRVETITSKRKKEFEKTNKLLGTLEQWQKIIDQVPRDSFRLGAGTQNWKANFDYILREEKAIKLLEEWSEWDALQPKWGNSET